MRFKASLGLLLALALMQLPSAGATSAPALPDVSAAVDTAIAHVRDNAASFGVTAADVEDLAVTDAYRSAHNGVTHVYLRQRLNRLDVLDGTMTVGVGRDGKVFHTGSRLIGDLAASAAGAVALSPTQAFASAVAQLGAVAPRETAAPKIVYQPSGDTIRLAWNLEIEDPTDSNWWNVAVDAQNGDLLKATDYVVHDDANDIKASIARTSGSARTVTPLTTNGPGTDGAKYNVFALPLESPNDGPRTVVTNPSLPAASPYGWHDTNGTPGAESTLTTGNNVNAALDLTGPGNAGGLVDPMHADGGTALNFDFPLDTTQPPITYKDAAVSNLFYWNNIIHDVFYGYGFDEMGGNFQVNQYGKGIPGRDDDAVQADAQDGGGVNNANFGTPPDGSRPRMQMFVWNAGRRLIDGDLDAGVIVHEYGHGISNRLTGGPTNTSCLRNQEQAGEGWSDFLAIALTARAGDVGTTKRGLGTYVNGESSRTGAGIRPTTYRTQPNSATPSPSYNSIKTQAVPHGVGYVWATMLWDMYWALADAHGFNPDPYGAWNTGGNNRAIQLVMDGMKLQACSPGFVDSRDGILAADVALTGGADRCRIWRAFARRGLGLSADQGASSSVTDGTSSYSIPADC